jgi:preprotein translocase subunit SecG
MEEVILVIHLFLALGIIGLVLLQRSEGGGLGIGGGGLGNIASPMGTKTLLTRLTAVFAAAFFCTSLVLGILAGAHSSERQSIMSVLEEEQTTPAALPAVTPEAPAEEPSAPISE